MQSKRRRSRSHLLSPGQHLTLSERERRGTNGGQEDIEELTQKWIGVCQKALKELQAKAIDSGEHFTIKQLMEWYHIDPEHMRYSEETDDFE